MIELATKSNPTLSVIVNLFDELHEKNIRYCHWKGHDAHLIASLTGESDLDILFDERQKEKLEPILATIGFKRFEAIQQKRFNGIVDYLGLDLQSGRLIHLHAHYKLPMGELYLKGYQSDLEDKILDSRIFNTKHNTYCIQPALQFVILFLMESLKLRHRDALLIRFRNKTQFREKTLQEYYWLKKRVTDSEVHDLLLAIFKDPAPLEKIIDQGFNRRQLLSLAPLVKTEFSKKLVYSVAKGTLLRWYREVTVHIIKKLSGFWPLPIRRINPRGGITVVLIGADGSGKSTLARDLRKTFEGKLDVCSIYFGRGEGNISWTRKRLQELKDVFFSEKKPITINDKDRSARTHGGVLNSLYKIANALLVAGEKRKNLLRMQAAKRKGMLVICDRYPQNQIMYFNDGPLLHALKSSTNPLYQLLAKIESKIYERAEETPPDIVFKLIAEADVVEKRKPGETSIQKLEAKINGIKQLRFDSNCKVVSVDATKPLLEILSIIKKEIWNIM